MCDFGSDGPAAWCETWRRARIEHKCCACWETIRPGDRYHYASGVWDGHGDSFKHCARCWAIFTKLLSVVEEGGVELRLNCGAEWRDNFDPAEEPVELAFITIDEAQEQLIKL